VVQFKIKLQPVAKELVINSAQLPSNCRCFHIAVELKLRRIHEGSYALDERPDPVYRHVIHKWIRFSLLNL